MQTFHDAQKRWMGRAHIGYVKGDERSAFLLDIIQKFNTKPHARGVEVLEIGCNVGRNLNYLVQSGFQNIFGIEINQKTEVVSRQAFPELWEVLDDEGITSGIIYDSVESYFNPNFVPIGTIEESPPGEGIDLNQIQEVSQFDVIFSMAFFEHVHPDSAWIFDELYKYVRPGGVLITIDDEQNQAGLDFVFARNYKDVLEMTGFKQVFEQDAADVPGLKEGYVARVFELDHS